MKRLIVIAAALALAACTGESRFEQLVKEQVKFRLTDPESAQFSETYFNEEKGIACGAVNAKNLFGGYVGKRLWVFEDHRLIMQEDANLKEIDAAWERCIAEQFPGQT